eukprot:CAMPEP_0201283604 /NCGR_PEP_ID=MMETSP1317-20130820/29264_1 /ASSEMBLY_ACC=CAM_ASM_000770 /TAXON_ID=187299 /ORGANISM="Undescribed Undescribed, Strain Undescribed" /LENGTH=247 /DNA_ID=CAMNT_0047600471 /DNA_START=350 /DNA_END=1093 /DNA_ORIENTATION=-
MAGVLSEGTTIIENAASEPEVVDFGNFLIKMGARIQGVGTSTIIIKGVKELKAVDYTVMDDRLDAGTFIMTVAATGGDVSIIGGHLDQMRILCIKLEQMGVSIEADGKVIRVRALGRLKPVNAITWPYPGLSTDFLPGLTAIASIADGTSYFRENIFEDRFTQLKGLAALGANVERKSRTMAVINGVDRLKGTVVEAPDLRAGMAYVIAGLCAEGDTIVENVYQIERGHCHVDKRFKELGATIKREE